MTEPLLELRSLGKNYGGGGGLFRSASAGVVAVEDVSFSVQPGETLALVGESGCGKSTTARLASRLVEPSSGQVFFDAKDVTHLKGDQLRRLRENLQMVFQDPFASLNPRMTVQQIIMEPLIIHKIAVDRAARVVELMQLVGLRPDHATRYPHEFSGGQRQRIGIARALALNPKLLICDEPVSALDVSIQAQIINLLMDLRARLKLSFLFISHDLSVVRHIADRVAVMHLGRLIELAPKERLFSEPAHPYTRALLTAVPQPDPTQRKHAARMPAKPVSVVDRAGCLYRSRCPLASEICATEAPPTRQIAPGHDAACHHFEQQEPFAPRREGMTLTQGAQRRFELYVRKRTERLSA